MRIETIVATIPNQYNFVIQSCQQYYLVISQSHASSFATFSGIRIDTCILHDNVTSYFILSKILILSLALSVYGSIFFSWSNQSGCLNGSLSCKETAQRKKATIHHITTMLATSTNVLFPGHNHLLTTGTDDP